MQFEEFPNTATVLLVEDSSAIALGIQGFLEEPGGGLRIEHVKDLAAAVARVARGGVDVVLLDLGLPDSEGLATFIRMHKQAPDVPTVVVTSVDDEHVALDALRKGAQDYLVKSEVNGRMLHRAIRYAIERKQAEVKLRESEAKHRTLLEVLPEIVYKIDPTGHFTFINSSVQRLGYRPEELIGQHFSVVVHPADLEGVSRRSVLPRFEGKVTGPDQAPKLLDERRGGARMTRDLVFRLVPKGWSPDAESDCVIGVLTSYGEASAVGVYPKSESTKERKFAGTVGVIRDITDRRRAEQDKAALEEQLQQAQKMEAIGQLAGGVAHDMNNVLAAVLGSAAALETEFDSGDPRLDDVANILAACRKGRDLTRDLLGFARKGKYLKETVQLNDIVSKAASLLSRTIPKKLDIRLQLAQELEVVEGDRGQLHHALMNVCLNAADAMGDHGSLVISTRNVFLDEAAGARVGRLPAGRYAEVQVADTGIGMDENSIRRAFEPFFTTKPEGKGTGLGLSMVYGVSRNHGGATTIESGVGQGTVVTFLLEWRPVDRFQRC